MLKINDYLIEQIDNKIIITMPQTMSTTVDTVTPVSYTRKDQLDEFELGTLLTTAIYLVEKK